MKQYPLYAALEHAKDMYGVDIDEDLFETYAMSAWLKIGNKNYRTYLIKVYPQMDPNGGWYVCKPCNLDSIEAITLNHEAAQNTSSIINNPSGYTHGIEDGIEASKYMPNHLYIPGKFVKYKELGDKIYFTEPFRELNLLYKGLYTDENGLPYINEKEVEAIALYCAYSDKYKKVLMTKDASELQIAGILKQDWLKACSSARIPIDISQNNMNEILDTLVRRDVHRFGLTYKPIL